MKIDKPVSDLEVLITIVAIALIFLLKFNAIFSLYEKIYIVPDCKLIIRLYQDSRRNCIVLPSNYTDSLQWKDSIIIYPIDREYCNVFHINNKSEDDYFISGFMEPHLKCRNEEVNIIEIQ